MEGSNGMSWNRVTRCARHVLVAVPRSPPIIGRPLVRHCASLRLTAPHSILIDNAPILCAHEETPFCQPASNSPSHITCPHTAPLSVHQPLNPFRRPCYWHGRLPGLHSGLAEFLTGRVPSHDAAQAFSQKVSRWLPPV